MASQPRARGTHKPPFLHADYLSVSSRRFSPLHPPSLLPPLPSTPRKLRYSPPQLLDSPPTHVPLKSKKPIYDAPPRLLTPPETTPTTPTPTDRLAEYVSVVRHFINTHYSQASGVLDEKYSKYLSYERKVTDTIASLAPPKDSPETVLPGAIYVAVSAMAGSIIARRGIRPIRAVTPLLLGVGAGWMIIPETTRNVGNLLWEGEKKVPAIAETHLKVKKEAEQAWRNTEEGVKQARGWLDGKMKGGVKSVEDVVRKG